jgi:hypothetical protein
MYLLRQQYGLEWGGRMSQLQHQPGHSRQQGMKRRMIKEV